MNLRPPRRGSIAVIAVIAAGLIIAAAIAVWGYVELRGTEQRAEGQAGGEGGGLLGGLEEAFEDAFGGAFPGDINCLIPDRPFSAPAIGGASVEEEVAAIAGQVEVLRGLAFASTVDPEFASPAQVKRRVRELFLEEYSAAVGEAEERVLTALGAIPAGTDLRTLRSEVLAQQVAGYYDHQTGELVVRQAGAELSLTDRVVLAHELDHAVTDQALGLPVPDELRTGREDVDLAATALAEGDATLLMQHFAASLPLEEQLEGLDPSRLNEAIQAQAGLEELPIYLRQELLFPYEQGLAFVCDLYTRGGWEAVNDAYRDPPTTTAEIMFPERFRQGFEPEDPRDVGVGALLPPWHKAADGQVGAAKLMWLFAAPGGDPGRSLSDPLARAGEWAGGELRLWTKGPQTALSLSLVDRAGGTDLCRSIVDWYRAAFDGDSETTGVGYELVADGAHQDALVVCVRSEVLVGIAPNLGAAAAIVR